jgi:predicted nucleic acid-binding protein
MERKVSPVKKTGFSSGVNKTKGYLIDSDVLIDYLRGLNQARIFLLQESAERKLFIAILSFVEIYSGEETRDLKRRKLIDEFLNSFEIIPLDKNIAKQAGQIRRDYNKPFADAIIAASAISYDLILITKNEKHFSGVKNLKTINPYQFRT